MGKRSQFERVERDFYPTPYEAVVPLLGHLPSGCNYVEPCCGDGALMRHLSVYSCMFACDIEPRIPYAATLDFKRLDSEHTRGADYIITNPPWNRKILHPMIEHFCHLKPTWLLFDADWSHTRQSAKYMPWLVKIVSVGRVKWIPDSKMTGKDNCAWYLFDARHVGPTEFVGRV